jgi:pullulanase-type alpha-1,6-glucosidase
VYGEGWNFGEVADNARGVNATQQNIGGTGIGVFNDRLRDAVRGGGPFSGFQEQGFITGLADDPNGTNQGSADEMTARLLRYEDWIRIGLAGNLRDYALIDRRGDPVIGAEVDYNGSPAGYTLDPQENIVYISAHDNETLFDAIQAKASASASLAERVRMQNLGNSLVLLAQGVPFFHAGDDLLRSKSLDRNSYNSGDWFNRLDFTYQTNNWGVGLPVEGQDRAAIIGPLLADPALKPAPADILSAAAHFQEMLVIRKSSPLFRLRTAEEIERRLAFLNTGPAQTPGLIVMQLSDMEGGDLDPTNEQIVVLFNANKTAVTFADAGWVGLPFELHPIQQASTDGVVRGATFESANGAFTVPGRTAAVFVLSQAALESAPTPGVTPTATPTRVPPTPAPTSTPAPAPRPAPDAALAAWFILAMVVVTGAVVYWARRSARS